MSPACRQRDARLERFGLETVLLRVLNFRDELAVISASYIGMVGVYAQEGSTKNYNCNGCRFLAASLACLNTAVPGIAAAEAGSSILAMSTTVVVDGIYVAPDTLCMLFSLEMCPCSLVRNTFVFSHSSILSPVEFVEYCCSSAP